VASTRFPPLCGRSAAPESVLTGLAGDATVLAEDVLDEECPALAAW
jgi:hypothetical protein